MRSSRGSREAFVFEKVAPRCGALGGVGLCDLWLRTANAELTIGYYVLAANAAPMVAVSMGAR